MNQKDRKELPTDLTQLSKVMEQMDNEKQEHAVRVEQKKKEI